VKLCGLFSKVVNFIYPYGNCRICGKEIKVGFSGICFYCLKTIKKIKGNCCKICGRTLPENLEEERVCGLCLKESPPYERHISTYYYEGAIRDLVLQFKIGKRYQLAKLFAKAISRNVKEKYEGIDFDFVTYIPSPFLRRLLRGFCPAELIAMECSKKLKIPLKNILTFNKRVKPQKGLTQKQRKENLQNGFNCSYPFDRGAKILLIDDIFTTGTTLFESAKVIKFAKGEVFAATFAQRKRREIEMIEEGIED
jgi:ComF family protein